MNIINISLLVDAFMVICNYIPSLPIPSSILKNSTSPAAAFAADIVDAIFDASSIFVLKYSPIVERGSPVAYLDDEEPISTSKSATARVLLGFRSIFCENGLEGARLGSARLPSTGHILSLDDWGSLALDSTGDAGALSAGRGTAGGDSTGVAA